MIAINPRKAWDSLLKWSVECNVLSRLYNGRF